MMARMIPSLASFSLDLTGFEPNDAANDGAERIAIPTSTGPNTCDASFPAAAPAEPHRRAVRAEVQEDERGGDGDPGEVGEHRVEQRDGHVPLRRVRQRHAAPDGGGQTREHHQTVDETRREEAEGTQRGTGGEGDDDPGDAEDERLDEKIGADVGHRGSEFGEGKVHAGDEEHGARRSYSR